MGNSKTGGDGVIADLTVMGNKKDILIGVTQIDLDAVLLKLAVTGPMVQLGTAAVNAARGSVAGLFGS